MTTRNQTIRGCRKPKLYKKKSVILKARGQNAPFITGTVKQVKVATPKKPNSAQRKVCIVIIKGSFGSKKVTAYIPDEQHTVSPHSVVMIKGGRAQDLPGVKVTVQRGVLDAKPNSKRKNGRSKYGVKKAN